MCVSRAHRFLYDRQPTSMGKPILVLHGQVNDWFYHNVLYGCVNIRRTLELWALESGLKLTVTLRRDGVLDFSGNPDPEAARTLFDSAQPRRAPRYRYRPNQTASSQPSGDAAQSEEVQSQARQTADQIRHAVSSNGQAILNTFTSLTNLLASDVQALVLIEEFCDFIERLRSSNDSTVHEMVSIVKYDWYNRISMKNLLVFININDKKLKNYVFDGPFPAVNWLPVEGPEPSEIQAAIERLARRHGLTIEGVDRIANQLSNHGSLRVALHNITRIAITKKRINMADVLQLPPIDEDAIVRLRRELNELVGLGDAKRKFDDIERRARELRQRLSSGESLLPEETMHMVFLGGPGTGKTTVARIMARLFHALGLLQRSEVIEITASQVMSSFVGETRENMQRVLEGARGAVLFIDEAHQFGNKDSRDAREAIEALVPAAWNLRRELVIILAGYADRMNDFFGMDEGLSRRFPLHNRIEFHDYSLNELWEILERKLSALGYNLEEAARPRLRAILRRRMRYSGFGNAGGVENLVSEILENHRQGPAPQSQQISVADLPPLIRQHPEVLKQANDALGALVGLGPVRERIRTLLARMQYDLQTEASGQGKDEIKLHPGNMRFSGPPGTGKTTVGQLMADLLYGIGCLERHKFVVATRGDLVGAYQGHSAPQVRRVVENARNGVLFIDEAYGLVQGEHDEFGKEALTELVAQITKPENEGTVFILAGYKAELERLLDANPGLRGRFPIEIPFQNFTPEDCAELARRELSKDGYEWEEGVPERVCALAREATAVQGEHFGNARWVKGLIEGAVERMKQRVIEQGISPNSPDWRRVKLADLPTPAGGSATAVTDALSWTPRPEARELATRPPEAATRTEAQLGQYVADRAYQIVIKQADGALGIGTGFFVTADGLMATSAHVVDNARIINVLCGRGRSERKARVVRLHPDLDLALLAVDVDVPCAYLPLGESVAIAPLTELIVFGNAHVQPGEPGRLVAARVARNSNEDPLHIETDGAIEAGFSGGPALNKQTGVVIGIVRGGYGPSATLLVRVEQLKALLADLGYRFVG